MFAVMVLSFVLWGILGIARELLLGPRKKAPEPEPPEEENDEVDDGMPRTVCTYSELREVERITCGLCSAQGYMAAPRFCTKKCHAVGNKVVILPHLHMRCCHCNGRTIQRPRGTS